MSPHRNTLPLVLLAFSLALAACGGGGGAVFGGGISGTGKPTVTVGTITATDTLTVAGTAFDTSAASVVIDGLSAGTGDLRVGMTATVKALEDGGVFAAERVEVEEVVKGPLEAKLDANTLTVFGQTVQVDATTLYGPGISPASPDGLTVGDSLEVYGYVRASGVAFATRIEREGSLSSFRLTGFASGVNTTAQTFLIGAQIIDYSSADTGDLPGGVPQNGQFLDVRGLDMLSSMGELVATEIRTDDLDDEEDNEKTEVEGFVTAVLGATRFVVSGIPVDTTGATVYEGGLATDVVVGVRVEVKGPLTLGVLSAQRVAFDSDVRLESDVATVVGSTITLVGLPGVSIAVNTLTEYEENAASLGDIVAGDRVEIRGRSSGPGAVTASRVKETGADDDIEIQGPIDASPAPATPWLSILGVAIDTSPLSESDFRGPEETVIGRSAFFAALQPGLLVKIEGKLVGGVPAWDRAEIEEEDD